MSRVNSTHGDLGGCSVMMGAGTARSADTEEVTFRTRGPLASADLTVASAEASGPQGLREPPTRRAPPNRGPGKGCRERGSLPAQ